MSRKNYCQIDSKLNFIGKTFKFNNIDYKLISIIGKSWKRKPYKTATTSAEYLINQAQFIPHPDPQREGLSILQSFKEVIIADYEEISINFTVVAFYSSGPSGLYTDVFGKIGDVSIKSRALMSGTAQRYDRIECIPNGEYLFYINYSLNDFLFAVFKMKS